MHRGLGGLTSRFLWPDLAYLTPPTLFQVKPRFVQPAMEEGVCGAISQRSVHSLPAICEPSNYFLAHRGNPVQASQFGALKEIDGNDIEHNVSRYHEFFRLNEVNAIENRIDFKLQAAAVPEFERFREFVLDFLFSSRAERSEGGSNSNTHFGLVQGILRLQNVCE